MKRFLHQLLSRAVVVGFMAVGTLAMAWADGSGTGQADQSESAGVARDALGLTPEERAQWTDFFARTVGVATAPSGQAGSPDDAARQLALDEFMNADPEAMPPGVRFAYYLGRLEWIRKRREPWDPRRDAYWLKLKATRDRLMQPRADGQDALTDADLLYWVVQWCWRSGFEPPASVLDQLTSPAQKLRYQEEHYSDVGMVEETLHHIVAHFDPLYLTAIRARLDLAMRHATQGKLESAFDGLRALRALDGNAVKDVPPYVRGEVDHPIMKLVGRIGRPVNAGAQVFDSRTATPEHFRVFQRSIPATMAHLAASQRSPADAWETLDALTREWAAELSQSPPLQDEWASAVLTAAVRSVLAEQGIRTEEQARSAVERIREAARPLLEALPARYPLCEASLRKTIDAFYREPIQTIRWALFVSTRASMG